VVVFTSPTGIAESMGRAAMTTPRHDEMCRLIEELAASDAIEACDDLAELARIAADDGPERKARAIRLRAEREVRRLLKG
jgi:hypothetical protein